MSKYQDKLSEFANRIKTEESAPPLQKVGPISKVKQSSEPEIQLNIWIKKSIMKKIKQVSLNKDRTIKDLVTEVLITYINNL